MATEERPLQEPSQPENADASTTKDTEQPAEPIQPSSTSSDDTHIQDGQQQSDAIPSPPLPNRHTATTPGPRAQRFQEMFDLALNHTLTKISLDNFASCYPTIAAQAPHILKQVQKGMVDRLAQLCNQEFAAVLSRYQVVARLNELESLVSDAEQRRRRSTSQSYPSKKSAGKRKEQPLAAEDTAANEQQQQQQQQQQENEKSKPTPPHLLPASAVLAAHLAPHLAGQQSQMNARLQNTQAANATLWENVQAQRREVEELLDALEAVLRDVDGAAALMDGVPAEELARESMTVDAEMADV